MEGWGARRWHFSPLQGILSPSTQLLSVWADLAGKYMQNASGDFWLLPVTPHDKPLGYHPIFKMRKLRFRGICKGSHDL